MGCGCKGGKSVDTKPKEDMTFVDYIKKGFILLLYTIIMIMISPIAFCVIWYVGMKLISGNLAKTLERLIKLRDSLRKEEVEELDKDEFELVGVEEIKK